jgi:hypothetical protein
MTNTVVAMRIPGQTAREKRGQRTSPSVIALQATPEKLAIDSPSELARLGPIFEPIIFGKAR